MHIGLRLPSNGPNAIADQIIRTGQLAETLGFDSVWCNDHIITPPDSPTTEPYGRLYETFITLAALSTITERVKLGAGVLVLPLREPVLVAKQAATLDVIGPASPRVRGASVAAPTAGPTPRGSLDVGPPGNLPSAH